MFFINYYNQIKEVLIKNESFKRVKDYSKNKSDLNSYFEVGRLIVEAQGGEVRAKYGNKLIKEYSEKLTKELGSGYSIRTLKYMRKFFLFIQKGHALQAQLSWNHYKLLLSLKNNSAIKYYIYITKTENLSYRQLQKRIKSNEYERIGYKEEFEKPKINSLIKNPIIIKTKDNIKDKISEYTIHNLILEDMDSFLKELGIGFAYIGHEIKIGENKHSIDFLLFNTKFNLYVVVEIKAVKLTSSHIGQIKEYMNYVDKNIKEVFHDHTVGIIICKKEDKFVLEYCSDDKIFASTYELKKT